MLAGYLPAWILFAEAVDHVARIAGCDRQAALDGLLAALSDGVVASRWADTGDRIDPARWLPPRILVNGVMPVLRDDRPRRAPHVQDPVRPIELRREDVERLWPGGLPAATPPPASRPLRPPTKIEAFRAWVARQYPEGVPAGITRKMLAQEFKRDTKVGIDERTIRRALNC